MTEDEAKKKFCPILRKNCIASKCMAWEPKRKIFLHNELLREAIQKKYKNIEVMSYNGLQVTTVLGGDCRIFTMFKKS